METAAATAKTGTDGFDLIFFFAPPTRTRVEKIYIYVTNKYRVHSYVRHRRTVVLHAQLHYIIILLYFINACIILYKRVPTPPTVALYLLLYLYIYLEICVLTLYI